jgi:UDP-N-acetylglucosamine/UDP-N-acetylgalactosamine diphosphorylase
VFAPVKNASGQGADTPETAQAAILALHSRWLRKAGIEPGGHPVEINPLFALDAEELAAKLPRGLIIDGPTYFA